MLDSGSTDRTVEIAHEMGATVHHNPFVSFGQQRNWAIDHIACRHQWHFHLDADERFTPALLKEIAHEIGPNGLRSQNSAYLVPSKMIFLGKWLRYAGGYPAYQMRLFHRERCRFIDFGHGQREDTTGPVARLRQPYEHYNFSKGLYDWFIKHNRYSDQESAQAIAVRAEPKFKIGEVWSNDPIVRRRALKEMSFYVRGRSLWRFVDMYIRRGGWLDGSAGFHYCVMISSYEYWTELKIREREGNWLTQTNLLSERMARENI